MNCKICGSCVSNYGEAEILNKYKITYYKCDECGFIQTEEPYWLDEAYSDAIANSDIGILSRNIGLNKIVTSIIHILFRDKVSFLDYGGGYGIFTRMMRDNGFDFEWYDKYCKNLFAIGHERTKAHYDVVTAFELMEHLQNPREEFARLCSLADNIICTTALQPKDCPKLDGWWYFCLDHGQHVSIFTERAMEYLARINGKYYMHYGDVHIFSSDSINKAKFFLCCRFPTLVNKLFKRRSLLPKDYEKITGKTIK